MICNRLKYPSVFSFFMEPKYTYLVGDLIPEQVGTKKFPYHLGTALPEGATPERLMACFNKNMHPSKGEPTAGSRFGGLYLGNYYEGEIRDSQIDVWGWNEEVTQDITKIIVSEKAPLPKGLV